MFKYIYHFIIVFSLVITCISRDRLRASESSDTDATAALLKGSSPFTDDQFMENVVGGGPPPDGIPPIEDPVFESVSSAGEWLDQRDRVFIVESQEGVRIYPQPILVWHEIVNQQFNGRAGSLTYCPLVGVVAGYYTDLNDENTTFGTSGKLVNNNLIMYDRQTSSYWPQILGEAINGPHSSAILEAFPVYWATWENAVAAYPDAEVLSRQTGFFRPYGSDPYGDYITERGYYFTDELLFGLMNLDDRLDLKRQVIGLKTSLDTAAFPKNTLTADRPVLNIEVADAPVVAFHDQNLQTIRTFSRVNIDTVLTFAFRDGNLIDLNTESVWTEKGKCVSGKLAGSQLNWVESMETFWFAWIAFYPETQLFGIDTDNSIVSP